MSASSNRGNRALAAEVDNRPVDTVKTIDLLFEESDLTVDDVAERSGLPPARVEAIAVGRWLPSPDERRRIAATFGVSPEQVAWGHSMDPRNIRYRRFGLRENF